MQDFDLFLTNHKLGRLLFEIAESDAQQRLYILHCLCELTYESVKTGGEDIMYSGYLTQRVSDWKSKPDIIEWARKSEEFVSASSNIGFNLQDEYDCWVARSW